MAGIDTGDERFRADPYPEYARLRGEARVHCIDDFDGVLSWLVSRYDDVRDVLTDRRLSKDPATAGEDLRQAGIAVPADPLKRNMINTDPPEHTRLRRLVSRAFTPRRMEQRLRPTVERTAAELLDRMEGEAEVDLIEALALPLQVTAICDLLGVPDGERERFHAWLEPAPQPSPAAEPGRGPGTQRVRWEAVAGYLADLVAERRRAVRTDLPEDEQPDLISLLIAARDEGDRLTEHELIATLSLLLLAGIETTVNLIANGMLALFEHPDQLRLLRERPEIGPQAVEELLRYTSPAHRSTFRFAREEIEIDGVAIPAGALVSAGLASANRDGRRFPDPDRLDLLRADNQHVAFGHGLHTCLGAPMARLVGLVGLTGLVGRFPDIALAVPAAELRWRPTGFFHGLSALPVRLRLTSP